MRALLLAVAAAVALSSAAQAETTELFFDDFDSNFAGPNRTPSGWTVSRGAVDIVGPGYFPMICSAEGVDCIDLDGSIGQAGLLSTASSFALNVSSMFTLSFDYSWNYFNQQNGNSMRFGVGGFSQDLAIPSTETRGTGFTPYTPLSFSFAGDGSSGSIFFDHAGGDNGGIVIDNVRLTETPSTTGGPVAPVPLPASLPLLLAGLGGMVALRRKQGAR